jgi:hypothetical protein
MDVNDLRRKKNLKTRVKRSNRRERAYFISKIVPNEWSIIRKSRDPDKKRWKPSKKYKKN